MTDKKRGFNVHDIAVVGLMAALVFVMTYLNIKIPIPLSPSPTMLHFGNTMCLLSALLFGKTRGGLAAGLGSMFYDLLDPLYISEFWITFIMKFTMAFVAGAIAHGGRHAPDRLASRTRTVLGAICGGVTYVTLYVVKTFIKDRLIYGYELQTVLATMGTKGMTSLTNNLVAVVVSLLLYTAIRPALRRAGLSDKLGVR